MLNRNLIRTLAGLLLVGITLFMLIPGQTVAQASATDSERVVMAPDADRYSQAEQLRVTIMIVAGSVLVIAVLAILVVLLRRLRLERQKAEERPPKAFLNDRVGITGRAAHELGRKPTMIGRIAGDDSNCFNFIVVPDNTIGRRHALIEYKQYGFWIIDQGSPNGTYVNDHIVTTEIRLKHGDCIRLHKFEFEFVQPEKPAGDATAGGMIGLRTETCRPTDR